MGKQISKSTNLLSFKYNSLPVWQTPLAKILIRTSPFLGGATSIVSIALEEERSFNHFIHLFQPIRRYVHKGFLASHETAALHVMTCPSVVELILEDGNKLELDWLSKSNDHYKNKNPSIV